VSARSGDKFEANPEGESFLINAAVLTVLAAPPPADAFRPPYVGADKTIRHRESDLDYTVLAHLTPAPGMPDIAALESKFRHLWLDHAPEWVSRYLHPQMGLSDYYRGFTSEIGTAALYVNMDVSQSAKRDLVVRLVQIGIDNYAVMTNGARWGVNGHCNGRKFPILFAGKMLGDAAMLSVGTTFAPVWYGPGDARNQKAPFSEDGQTFYVEETSPGVYNWGYGGYTAADVGLPEWGNFHLENLAVDTRIWDPPGSGYRVCCSANGWTGQTLAMRIMGLRDAWAQPAYFDYMDRYMAVPQDAWKRAWVPWHAAMWDAHRGAL
jgi:hypothetical protein